MIHHDKYGKGVDAIFGEHEVVVAPFPRAGRRKDLQDYDPDAVATAIRNHNVQTVDPRGLYATQPSVTKVGVQHYTSEGDYAKTGKTFADEHKYGNDIPVVYNRTHNGQITSMLLSGHHRGTAALAEGRQFDAIVAEGGYGPPRRRA